MGAQQWLGVLCGVVILAGPWACMQVVEFFERRRHERKTRPLTEYEQRLVMQQRKRDVTRQLRSVARGDGE